jgi:hypothetical protein
MITNSFLLRSIPCIVFSVSITRIEHFPNELLHEVFDYLDGGGIYYAFYNLNARFQHLITCLSFLLKIKFRP